MTISLNHQNMKTYICPELKLFVVNSNRIPFIFMAPRTQILSSSVVTSNKYNRRNGKKMESHSSSLFFGGHFVQQRMMRRGN